MSAIASKRIRSLALYAALAALLLMVMPTAQATITTSGTMVVGVDLVAGTADADYDLDFATDVTNASTEFISIVFPSTYTIGGSATVQDLASSASNITIAGADGQAVTVTTSGQEVRLQLSTAQDLQNDRIQFRILTGVTNPTVSGTTTQFTINIGTTVGASNVDSNASAGTVNITAGALSSGNVTPADFTAGTQTTVTVTFVVANPWPNDGIVVIDFPAGYVTDASSAATNPQAPLDATFSVGGGGGSTLTVTRTGGGTGLTAGQTATFDITLITNPVTTADPGDFTFTTRTSGPVDIDTATFNPTGDVITAGALGSTNVQPDSLLAGAAGDVNVAFTTANPIPADGKIVVTFGGSFVFDSGGTTATAALVNIDGLAVTDITGQVVTITRSGAIVNAGVAVEFDLTFVKNPTGTGTTNTYTIETKTSGDVLIDDDAAVAADTIAPAVLDNFLVEAAGGGPIGTQVAGGSFNIKVTARDAFNNTLDAGANDFNGAANTVDITSNVTGSAGLTTTAGFTNGVLASHAVTLTQTSGVAAITATDTDPGGLGNGTQTGVSATFVVDAALTDIGTSTVASSPGTILANATTISTITVTLRDEFLNVVVGNTVTLTAGAGSSVITGSPGTSDSNGVATFTVKDATVEVVTYTAADTTDTKTVTQTADVSFTLAVTDAGNSTLVASPTSVPANGTTTSAITVTLLDADSVPLATHSVTLTAGAGTSVITGTPGTTNGSGVATFTVTNTTTEAVIYTVEDTDDSVTVTQTATVTFDPQVTNVGNSTVTRTPTSVLANGTTTSTITVTLRDSGNVLISGHAVSLAADTGSSVISGPSGLSVSGVVTFTVTNTTAEGPVTYTATDDTDTVTVGTAAVTFTTPVTSASVSTVAADPTTGVFANGETTSTITVTLLDSGGVPLVGHDVTLAGTGSTVISAPSGVSDGSGVVTFTVTNTTAQTVTYSATDTTETGLLTPTANVTFITAALTSTSVVPDSLAAGDTGDVVVTFTKTNDVTGGRVAVTFPTGFVVSGAGVNPTGNNNITGSLSIQDVTGQVVTIQGVTVTGTGASFTLTGIQNPTATGATGNFTVRTQDGSGAAIDVNASVTGVTIIGGAAITNVGVTLTSAVAGATTDYTVTFTTSVDLNTGNSSIITVVLPTGTGTAGMGDADVTVGAPGGAPTPITGLGGVGGLILTIPVPDAANVDAGEVVTVVIGVTNEVTNPATTGAKTLTVATDNATAAEDQPAVTSASYAITGGTITGGAVTLTNPDDEAGAETDGTVAFTLANPVGSGQTIVLTFPDGWQVQSGAMTIGNWSGLDQTPASVTGNAANFTVTIVLGSGGDQTTLGVTLDIFGSAQLVNQTVTATGLEILIDATGQTQGTSSPFAITAGALTDASVVPDSLVAGATDDVVVSFLNTNAVNAGRIAVTFPADFDVSGAGVNPTGTNISGTLSILSVSGQVVTIQGATIEAALLIDPNFTLTGIKNPTTVATTGTFTIQTQTSSGTLIDEVTGVTGVGITAATITGGAVSLTNPAVSAQTAGTVSFTLANPLASGDSIVLTFPEGWVVQTSMTEGNWTGLNAAPTSVTGNTGNRTVTIVLAADQTTLSVTLAIAASGELANPAETGTGLTILIDAPNHSQGTSGTFSITGGAVTGGAVTLTDAAAGAQTDGTVAFTLAAPVANGQSIVLTFPSGWTVQDGALTASNWTGLVGTITLVTGDATARTVTIELPALQPTGGKTLTITGSAELLNPPVTASGLAISVGASGQAAGNSDTFDITAGPLSSTGVVPASLVAGVTGDVVVTFTTANAISGGKVVVTFPAGFDVSGVGTTVAAQTNITGTLAVTKSGSVVTITGGTAAAGAAVSLTLTGITNPTVTGNSGTFTIQTQTSAGTLIDEDASLAEVIIEAEELTSTSVIPASLVAGLNGEVVVAFTTVNAVSAGRIVVTFPSDFVVTGADVNATGVNITGTLSILDVTGLVVTVEGATIAAGAGASFTLTNIKNPTQTGLTGTFEIETQAGDGTSIDADTSVVGVTITGGAVSSITLALTSAAAGAQTAGTVAFTLTDPVADGQDIVLTFPAGWTVQEGALTATNWQDLDGATPTSVTGDETARTVTIELSAAQTTTGETLTIVASAELLNPELAQTDITISVSASGQPQGTSADFDITFAAAAVLVVTTEPVPGDRQAGEASILTQPVLEIRDAFGNVVTSGSGSALSVAATLTGGSGALTGAAAAAVSGVATLTDLSIDTTGADKVLTFSATGVASVDSAAFTVSAVTLSVATTGDDGNDCLSVGEACETINGAIGKAINGDTISVLAGTYDEQVVVDKALTLQGAGVTSIIAPAAGHGVDIQSSSVTVENLKIVSVDGSAIRLTTDIIHDSITINNNTLETEGSQAVIWTCGDTAGCKQTTDLTVTGNTITADAGAGLLALGSATPHAGWTVASNTFDSATGVNLELRDVDSVTVNNNTFGVVAGNNVNIITDQSNLTGAIVFSNNTLIATTTGDALALSRTASTIMVDVTITGNTFDAWGVQAILLGAGVSGVTVDLNSFLLTGDGIVALNNAVATAVDAEDNFWGKASGPGGGGTRVGDGGDIIGTGAGNVDYRPWLLSDGGDTFTQTIVLTVKDEWVLISAPNALDEVPIVVDDDGGTVVMMAFVNGAFVSPGALFDADVVTPASAFFVKAKNLAAIGFRSGLITPPTQTAKELTVGWNLVGTNFEAFADDEFSSIQDTSQNAGLVTLYVPNTLNNRKEAEFTEQWTTPNAERDLNGSPITLLPTTTKLSINDGYWVFMNGARTYSKQVS